MSFFLRPMALSVPTSFILERKDDLSIRYISMRAMARTTPARIRAFLVMLF